MSVTEVQFSVNFYFLLFLFILYPTTSHDKYKINEGVLHHFAEVALHQKVKYVSWPRPAVLIHLE